MVIFFMNGTAKDETYWSDTQWWTRLTFSRKKEWISKEETLKIVFNPFWNCVTRFLFRFALHSPFYVDLLKILMWYDFQNRSEWTKKWHTCCTCGYLFDLFWFESDYCLIAYDFVVIVVECCCCWLLFLFGKLGMISPFQPYFSKRVYKLVARTFRKVSTYNNQHTFTKSFYHISNTHIARAHQTKLRIKRQDAAKYIRLASFPPISSSTICDILLTIRTIRAWDESSSHSSQHSFPFWEIAVVHKISQQHHKTYNIHTFAFNKEK